LWKSKTSTPMSRHWKATSAASGLSEMAVVKDQETQRSQSFEVIPFTNPEHASGAIRVMSPWMVTRCVWTMQASLPEHQKDCLWGTWAWSQLP
jgi:hypothetical protein